MITTFRYLNILKLLETVNRNEIVVGVGCPSITHLIENHRPAALTALTRTQWGPTIDESIFNCLAPFWDCGLQTISSLSTLEFCSLSLHTLAAVHASFIPAPEPFF